MVSIKMTDDMEHREKILFALKRNGGYCPCSVQKTNDTKCMCKDFRETDNGICHCGLYIKETA